MTEYSNENTEYQPHKMELPPENPPKCKCGEKDGICKFLEEHDYYMSFCVYTKEEAKKVIELFDMGRLEITYDKDSKRYGCEVSKDD